MVKTRIGVLVSGGGTNLQALIDSNSVIGKAVTTPDGTTILPVSKVTFGYASGGSDLPATQKELFGGGTGGGVSITPIAFLVIRSGDVKVLPVQPYQSTADRVVGMAPDLIDKVSGLVNKPKTEPAGSGA